MTVKRPERRFPITSTWTPWALEWATVAYRCVVLSSQSIDFACKVTAFHFQLMCSLHLLRLFQVTFQACSISEARYLYDQLATFCPIVVSYNDSLCLIFTPFGEKRSCPVCQFNSLFNCTVGLLFPLNITHLVAQLSHVFKSWVWTLSLISLKPKP